MIAPEVRALLEDILAYGHEALELVGDRTAETILGERLREHAVLRTVQIVGEAAAQALKREPGALAAAPELRRAVGLRNMLVHGYGKIRMNEVVAIVRGDLPGLLTSVETILGDSET